MPSPALLSALTDAGPLSLRPVPPAASQLLTELDVPPRLAAHLRLVHDVAHRLTGALHRQHPGLVFDREAVLYGAATHDIGKVRHLDELSGPGSAHEPAGYALLIERGVPDPWARFARTHGSWAEPDVVIEDLLVSLADKVWKAKRVEDLEALVIAWLSAATGTEVWQSFVDLDDILAPLAADAERRLAFQFAYPITGPSGAESA